MAPELKKYPLNEDLEKPLIIIISPDHLKGMYEEIVSGVKALANFEIIPDSKEIVKSKIQNAHGLIGCPRTLFEEVLPSAKNLRWVHNGGAGIEHYIFDDFVHSDIVFTNGKIIQGPECADHALALLLTLTRRINLVLGGVEKQDLPRPLELYNKKAVVMGLGGIGMSIAERAKAFGMKVVGVDQDYKPMLSTFERIVMLDKLCDELSDASVFFMAAPHTGTTQGIVDSNVFKSMKNKPYFINVSRGATVNTEDLLCALKEGYISGAGIDVTNPEPLDKDHELFKMDNVIITPHIAGLSDKNRERNMELVKLNIENFVNKKPLINIVDKKLGY